MKQKIIICNDQLRARAVVMCGSIPLDEVHEVIIKPHKRDRSAEQNALYWKWLTVIGNDLGNTKDEQHDIYKEMFLVHIFIRDDPDYAEMWTAINKVMDSMSAQSLKKEIIKLTSTTQASVKQMSEYLDDISHHASSLGIRLPAEER